MDSGEPPISSNVVNVKHESMCPFGEAGTSRNQIVPDGPRKHMKQWQKDILYGDSESQFDARNFIPLVQTRSSKTDIPTTGKSRSWQ